MNKTLPSGTTKQPSREELERVFDGLQPVRTDVAGIDVGSEMHVVAVAPERDEMPVRTFGCYTPDLHALADWLRACGVTEVVMESTGVYWVPLYRILEERGMTLALVNASHTRHVPGRKTDVWDCNWLRRLHTYGLLNGSFVPSHEVGSLRTLCRHRDSLVHAAAAHIQVMQKALEQMNVQLHKAVSDITGITAMRIIRAIAAGERDPKRLSLLRCTATRADTNELEKALTGCYHSHHVFVLAQALQAYDFAHTQMQACDEEIRTMMSRFEDRTPPGNRDAPATARPLPKQRKNQMGFDARSELTRVNGVDLTTIDGIDVLTALTILSEVGTNMDAFPTENHFASWLGLSPNNQITGGKVRKRRTRPVRNRAATALRIAAQALFRGKSGVAAYLRRMKARVGAPKAITATARKLACLVYRLMRYGQAYVDQGQQAYERHYHQTQQRWLRKLAAKQGFHLVAITTGQVVS